MARRRFSWTKNQVDKLNRILEVLQEWQEYLPLTLRQVYYQLVSKEIIENKVSEYTMLSHLVKWARIDGYIPWDAIEDRVRTMYSGRGWEDKEKFINNQMEKFLKGYRRHLMVDQDKFIEVWIEKDALSSIFNKVTFPYCVSTIVCRGFSSVTFLNDFRERVEYYQSQEKEPVMLYFGDFDPSGLEMLPAMETTLESEMGVDGIEFKRIALLKQDILDYRLPVNPDAVKKSDTRYEKFVAEHGTYAVELDALPPNILEQKIRTAIENEIVVDLFNKQVELQDQERKELTSLKSQIEELINGVL